MLLNVTLILFHVSLFFPTIVIISIGRKYFFINHCGVTTCGQTDQEPVKLSKVSIFLLILYLFCTFVQLYSDLTILTLHATTYLICDIKP